MNYNKILLDQMDKKQLKKVVQILTEKLEDKNIEYKRLRKKTEQINCRCTFSPLTIKI